MADEEHPGRKAARLLREAADAVDKLPSLLRFEETFVFFGVSRLYVDPKTMRDEADRIDLQLRRIAEVNYGSDG